MAIEEKIVVLPASPGDIEHGYPWKWEVSCSGERRSGACRTRVEAEREAAVVLALLREHPQRD
jgi:hypothetical protein